MYIIFNCVLYWRTLNLNKALLYLDSSTYFFSMLSVLNLIWAVYVGSWSLKKDGACLCLYFCVFFIYGCWAKNSDNNWIYWSSYFQMPDINSDLFGFFFDHIVVEQKLYVARYYISLKTALKDFHFTWNFFR